MAAAIVMLSGGLDSTVALHLAIRTYGHELVRAVSFDYGQRHGPIELARADRIAAAAGVPRETLRVPMEWATGALVDGSAGAPDARAAVVPGRNAIFATVAGAYACRFGASRVWIGCCAADAAVFRDCRPEWVLRMSAVLETGIASGLSLVAPFVDRSKSQIVATARDLGASAWDAVGMSWSCYAPDGDRVCGACGACSARAQGFAAAGEIDPAL